MPRGIPGSVAARKGRLPKRRNWPQFRPDQIEQLRAKIDASYLITRLQKHAGGTVKMEQTQVSAAMGLLRKVLPDLASVDLSAAGGGPLVIEIVRFSPENEAPLIAASPSIIDVTPVESGDKIPAPSSDSGDEMGPKISRNGTQTGTLEGKIE